MSFASKNFHLSENTHVLHILKLKLPQKHLAMRETNWIVIDELICPVRRLNQGEYSNAGAGEQQVFLQEKDE